MRNYLILLLVLAAFSNCEKEQLSDKQDIIINKIQFANASKDEFNFKSVQLVGDCLQLVISYGGGCGEIEAQLIDSGDIAESLPVQRFIRLSFQDNDLCEALVEKEMSFDLKPIRISQENQIKLNLEGWNESLLYSY